MNQSQQNTIESLTMNSEIANRSKIANRRERDITSNMSDIRKHTFEILESLSDNSFRLQRKSIR